MRSKKKDYLLLGSSILVLLITAILLFFPNLAGGFKNSYVELKTKHGTIEDNNLDIINNDSTIVQKNGEFDSLKEREEVVTLEASELKSKINPEDLIMDMPAFLISIEQEAKKNKLKLNIAYSQIQDPSGVLGLNPTAPAEPSNVTEVPPANGDTPAQDPSAQTSETGANANNQESSEFSADTIAAGSQDIPGINTTVIPMTIEGSYKNVRKYIKYLDEIGLIKPTSASITADYKDKNAVTAKIILNVYHGEV